MSEAWFDRVTGADLDGVVRCKLHGCMNVASHRFKWPGYEESQACEYHVDKLFDAASLLGAQLQMIKLPVDKPKAGE